MKKVTNQLVCVETVKTSVPTVEELPYIFVTDFDEAATIGFYKSFLALAAKPEVKVIPVVISSYGGAVYSLLSMLDIIKASNKPVATICLGKAMSCGATLLASGTKGYRYMAPNADLMIHEVSSVEWGKLADVTNGAKQTTKLNSRIFGLLEQFSGQKPGFYQAQMRKMSNVDWFLTPGDCKRLGIVDFIGVPVLAKK